MSTAATHYANGNTTEAILFVAFALRANLKRVVLQGSMRSLYLVVFVAGLEG